MNLIPLMTFILGGGWLIHKFLSLYFKERQTRLQHDLKVNTDAADAALVAVLEERLKPYDKRINDTWSKVSTTHEELNALRLQLGIRGVTK